MARMESPENQSTKITVRAPNRLVEEFDETLNDRGINRSEAIRSFIREVISQPADGEFLIAPRDDDVLARGYQALVEVSNGNPIPVREAKAAIAQKTNIPKESVQRRIIIPLRKRGYVQFRGDPIYDPWLRIRTPKGDTNDEDN